MHYAIAGTKKFNDRDFKVAELASIREDVSFGSEPEYRFLYQRIFSSWRFSKYASTSPSLSTWDVLMISTLKDLNLGKEDGMERKLIINSIV